MDTNAYSTAAIKDIFWQDFLWITSDQAAEFDDIFKFPFKDVNIVRDGARIFATAYFQSCQGVKTNFRTIAFNDMFEIWQRGGEDVERILFWYASIRDELSSKGSSANWHDVFWRWAKKLKHMPSYLSQERFQEFMQLMHRDYTVPLKKFLQRTDGIEDFWISSTNNRTDWDNFLWKHFFEEIYIAPVDYFNSCGRNLILRQFWKKNRHFLTAEEKSALYSDFVVELQLMYSTDAAFDWTYVTPIDDAIDIDSLPDFDKYKRDW